ncbi:hypothetical protein C0J52_18551, partial [Blattella germanica]
TLQELFKVLNWRPYKKDYSRQLASIIRIRLQLLYATFCAFEFVHLIMKELMSRLSSEAILEILMNGDVSDCEELREFSDDDVENDVVETIQRKSVELAEPRVERPTDLPSEPTDSDNTTVNRPSTSLSNDTAADVDDIPLAQRLGIVGLQNKRGKTVVNWKSSDIDLSKIDTECNINFREPDELLTPLQYFKLFFSNENKNYKLAFDKWFASHPLLLALKEQRIWTCCTVRSNRMAGCVMASDKSLKKVGRGTSDVKVDETNNIVCVKWFDNKSVNLMSSYAGVEPTDTVRRWSVKDKQYINVTRLAIVREYNQFGWCRPAGYAGCIIQNKFEGEKVLFANHIPPYSYICSQCLATL